jgi:hypothetical protein
VLVCETSVRLITGQDQASCADLADTVERAWWTAETLQVQNAGGTVTAITMTGHQLVAVPGQVPADVVDDLDLSLR